jgi:hypothetical protein
MGLVTDLVCLPIAGPARGLLFVFEKIKEAVDAELYDESRLEGALMRLSLQLDLGEISEAEYSEAEGSILQRLTEIREYKASLE